MRGFQLWINLPAREKMKPAGLSRHRSRRRFRSSSLRGGGRVKVIAGTLECRRARDAPGRSSGSSTDPLYLDVELPAGARFAQPSRAGYNAFVYVFEGSVAVGLRRAARARRRTAPACSSEATRRGRRPAPTARRFLLLAGRPLGEPVVQYGPFVMNTREEIEQAIRDYQSGELTRDAA